MLQLSLVACGAAPQCPTCSPDQICKISQKSADQCAIAQCISKDSNESKDILSIVLPISLALSAIVVLSVSLLFYRKRNKKRENSKKKMVT